MAVDADRRGRGLRAQWDAFIAPFRAPGPDRQHQLGWRPLALRAPYLASLVCLMTTMFLVLEGLRQYSTRQGGLVFFDDTDDVSALQSFGYNYVPIIIALILLVFWSVTDFDVLRLEPYFQLSKPGGAPATVLFINYNFGQTILTPINAARRRHWLVLWVSLLTLSIRMILPALQSTIFELREVQVIRHENMQSWPTLVGLETQATWMSTQANDTVDSVLSSDERLRRSRSSQYAVAPVEVPDGEQQSDVIWKLDQTLYWADVSCQNVPVNKKLNVSIETPEHGLQRVSWDASGIDLSDTYGAAKECVLDFHYDSVFFPETDYLQVRYWEPSIDATTEAEYPDTTKAFTATGCDPYDLYGMLISVNATTDGSKETEYSASGLAFACDIMYYKAQAQVAMHPNSSIESIRLHHATTRTLTAKEFNIDHFQALLSQRAPYTSDMIFISNNSTNGGRTVTELPVISEELGDLQPLLTLDTSSIMTQAEFTSKITRDVKQTFILTLGRLFDPDREPTIIAAVRSTTQVAIAVVTFAALWSELILGLAALTGVYLLFLYRSRETFLQCDPGSIGAMCSIAADIFHPNNILSEPLAEFHQFSTRQMRRIFKNARCHWRSSPSGHNRLEILAEDGSPVQLGENLRTRNDPMPHFLVIPFFIVEFLALAAVIILMALVVQSLARDGRFRHLTQSDSSSLQVVLSFLPSVVASSVSSLCTSIHRNLSVLEPWVHLQRGMATARSSLSLNYASQSPVAIFCKSVRDRHILLGLVSIACVINMVLTVVAGGLFTQEMTSSTLPTKDLTLNYSSSVFWKNDFAAQFTEYDLIQTSITSGVPMLPWTSPNESFVPLQVHNRDPDAMYGATTLGVGASLECQPLLPEKGLFHNKTTGHSYWKYQLFDNKSVECEAAMPTRKKDEGISLSIHFLSPGEVNDSDVCQTSTVLVVGRWDYLPNSTVSDENTIALHCEPRVRLQDYSVVFDPRGQINYHKRIQNTSVTEGTMFDNATVSLGQFNKVFAAIPESFVGNTTAHNGTYNISSYDWAGFLVARLYQREDPDFDSLDPARLTDLTQTVYQWVYSTYFSIWRDLYLEELDEPIQATNGTIIRIVLVVFGTRRGRFRGPRMPRSIGAIIPWIAHSRMLSDFGDTHSWNNSKRRDHLTALDKRYGFRMFMGHDGRWRFAVDEEPKSADAGSPPPPPIPSDSDANKTTSIQLRELIGTHLRRQN
ncbi:hypothetical protein N7509_000566 [Penicillium cosmopolitanum]|uniref:Uncharacterized protein n=1 Tax=Penicillium cosmopolitanum TaxID=1131564 RepID=A0A9W9WB76_9EURO|nr:uncharacterized protein N7509_000566 [Penicillium cosmopolitanum]KAJ5413939.1 hypothetical protein N7509_000566 [Penicillium cosmopolitanum]